MAADREINVIDIIESFINKNVKEARNKKKREKKRNYIQLHILRANIAAIQLLEMIFISTLLAAVVQKLDSAIQKISTRKLIALSVG